jgi:rod shape-determining protein MreC
MFACSCLIITSAAGSLAGIEGLAGTPLNFLSGIFTDVTQGLDNLVADLQEIQRLRTRNAELEEALARTQAEIVELREIASDAQRLAALLDYTNTYTDQETVVAEVISYDPNALFKAIIINKGTRDGVSPGMPVVTEQGLVGRVIDVTSNASRVLLVIDPSSYVSARLQTTRAQGSVQGQLTGNLEMIMIPLDAEVQEGDIVITSGLGGNFPADIPIGQVTSKRQFEFELNQVAQIRSLINFDTLEFVLVVTSFEPVDLSVFEEPEEE